MRTTVEYLRLAAMQSVMKPDGEYNLRYILRWYSRTFYTPLPEVEELPVEDVLRAYFETIYEDMEEDKRLDEIQSLLETEEEREAKSLEHDREEAEMAEFVKFSELNPPKKSTNPLMKAAEQIRQAADEIKKVENLPNQTESQPEVAPEVPAKLPPDIKMTFVDSDEEFERMLAGSFGPPPKNKPG